jgi:hypothetical protein
MIIHICGASGSGKTTLGKKLKSHFGKKLIVHDIDDLRDKVISAYEKTTMRGPTFAKRYTELFQQYVNELIAKSRNVPIVFVGLNAYILGEEIRFKGAYYPGSWTLDVHADHKFYIDLPTAEIIKQKYYREYDDFVNRFRDYMLREKDTIYHQAISDQKTAMHDITAYITEIIAFDQTARNVQSWNEYYKSLGYTLMTRDVIYTRIVSIIKSLK